MLNTRATWLGLSVRLNFLQPKFSFSSITEKIFCGRAQVTATHEVTRNLSVDQWKYRFYFNRIFRRSISEISHLGFLKKCSVSKKNLISLG